jgi:lipid II:glycine glycyltransferase (peptidoglycan interpeptide bridge formation enzyme)
MERIMAKIESPSTLEAAMMNREEYIQKLKSQLDEWNAEASKWEQKAQEAQSHMKAEYEKQLAALNSRRDEALYQMKLMQNASHDAWQDMMKGADEAWKNMQEAFNKARAHFDKR